MANQTNRRNTRHTNVAHPVPRYMPTYRLESKKPFDQHECGDLLKEIIEGSDWSGFKYSDANAEKASNDLSDKILQRLKAYKFDRYKIIVCVRVIENLHQSLSEEAKFWWEAENDFCVNYKYELSQIFVVATVYGIYFN